MFEARSRFCVVERVVPGSKRPRMVSALKPHADESKGITLAGSNRGLDMQNATRRRRHTGLILFDGSLHLSSAGSSPAVTGTGPEPVFESRSRFRQIHQVLAPTGPRKTSGLEPARPNKPTGRSRRFKSGARFGLWMRPFLHVEFLLRY